MVEKRPLPFGFVGFFRQILWQGGTERWLRHFFYLLQYWR